MLEDFLRRLYDHDTDSRGRADQSTVDYPLMTPVKLLGETTVLDQATQDRMLAIANLRSKDIKDYPGAHAHAAWIIQHEERLHAVSGWILTHRLASSPETFISTVTRIDEALTAAGKMESERQRKGLSAVVAALKWLDDLLTEAGAPSIFSAMPSDYLGQMIQRLKASREGTSPADHFIRFLESVVAADDRVGYEKNRYGEVPWDTADDKLKVGLTACRAAFDLYLKEHGLPRIEEQLNSDLLAKGLTVEEALKKNAVRVSGRVMRAYVLDVGRIEELYGVPTDFWIRRTTMGEA